MHEMGLALQIVEIAKASIPAELANARVERVNLKVGKMAAVVPESLRFCFEVITRNTPLEGAELHMEEVPVVARCHACRHEWTLAGPVFRCPACESGDVEMISGRELDIVPIEVEKTDDGVKSPISALRRISISLRRTQARLTPRDLRAAT